MPLIFLKKRLFISGTLRLTYPDDPIPRACPSASGNIHVGNLGRNIMSYQFYLRYCRERFFPLLNFNNGALIIATISRAVDDNYTVL